MPDYLGAAVPLLLIGYAGKHLLLRKLMTRHGQITRFAGVLVVLAGLLMITGLDRALQSAVQQIYQGWII